MKFERRLAMRKRRVGKPSLVVMRALEEKIRSGFGDCNLVIKTEKITTLLGGQGADNLGEVDWESAGRGL